MFRYRAVGLLLPSGPDEVFRGSNTLRKEKGSMRKRPDSSSLSKPPGVYRLVPPTGGAMRCGAELTQTSCGCVVGSKLAYGDNNNALCCDSGGMEMESWRDGGAVPLPSKA